MASRLPGINQTVSGAVHCTPKAACKVLRHTSCALASGLVPFRNFRYLLIVLPLSLLKRIKGREYSRRQDMGNTDIWKYCTGEQCRDMLLDFRLLGDVNWSREKQLACLYSLSNHAEEHYHLKKITGKSGRQRTLQIPDAFLKKVQKNLLRNVLDDLPVSSYATAYGRGKSILSNAVPHTGKEKILKLDMRDFFGNITFFQVRQNVFGGLLFPGSVGTLLTHLCCYRDYLPQGAPTSGAVSNLVLKSFDESLGNWCSIRKITYTRYCDDMTFSGSFDSREVKNKVESYLRVLGFELNTRKTKVLESGTRQMVTGIVVNEKPQADRDYRRRLRQECHYCLKYGPDPVRVSSNKPKEAYLTGLLGKVNYVLQINPEDMYFKEIKRQLTQLQREAGEFPDAAKRPPQE